MAYGVYFYGANGQLIFDSGFNSGSTQTLNPYYYSGSTLVSGTSSTSSAISYASDDLLFVNASGNLYGNVTYPSSGGKTFTPAQSVNYFIAKKTSSASNLSGSGTYGLEIFDSSGTVTFSTRRANSSINISAIFDDRAATHNSSLYSSNPGSSVYVSVGHMYYSAGSGTWGCYTFSSSGITFNSYINLGIFGSASIPNMGSLLVASLRS